MTEAKHTPGPWRYDWDDNGAYYIDADGRPSPCIAVISYDGEIAEANARLIAAAPDLLAALKLCVDLITRGVLVRDIRNDGDESWAMNAMKLVQDLNTMTAAIARAEGRQP